MEAQRCLSSHSGALVGVGGKIGLSSCANPYMRCMRLYPAWWAHGNCWTSYMSAQAAKLMALND